MPTLTVLSVSTPRKRVQYWKAGTDVNRFASDYKYLCVILVMWTMHRPITALTVRVSNAHHRAPRKLYTTSNAVSGNHKRRNRWLLITMLQCAIDLLNETYKKACRIHAGFGTSHIYIAYIFQGRIHRLCRRCCLRHRHIVKTTFTFLVYFRFSF